MQIGGDCNTNLTEGGDHKAALRQKKLKAKSLKWRSSNKDMNSKVETGRSEAVYDDTVLCSLTTASFNSLISRKNVRTHGKVAQQCDAIDPPVPRRLRSAINKRVRHVKKRRHLSAISAQISFTDQRTRLLTEEEEVADALLSLSQLPSTCEFKADKVIVDGMNVNVSSSYSEGAMKEGEKTSMLPTADDELSTQAASIAERTDNVPHVNPVSGATNQPKNINLPTNLENAQTKDLSSGVVVNLPSPCKDPSNNSARKQLKVPLDGKNYPTLEAQDWLVGSDKTDNLVLENGKAKNDSAQENVHRVQTPLPCTPDGYLIKPSSTKLAVRANAVSEFSKVTSCGNPDKIPLVNNGVPSKTWKRSSTHVYVSHLIQMHVNKEKASQCQVKPEERSHIIHTSRSPACPTTLHNKGNARDETCYAVHLDVRLPVQAPTGICNNMSAARQKMVSGNFLNLPTSTALPGQQHVQYLHPQITPRGPMPYLYPHLPHSKANLAPPATLQQMQQYMCNPAYAPPRPAGVTANSSALMKLQQHIPTQQQLQQQQMWQFHVAQYQQRPDAAPPGAAWHNMPSLRPLSMLPAPAMPAPQMELLCAPYQGGGGRQPQQLRLI